VFRKERKAVLVLPKFVTLHLPSLVGLTAEWVPKPSEQLTGFAGYVGTMTVASPLSVQLYSLRDECAQDFEAVLRRLGQIGFVGVELAGLHGLSAATTASILGDAGLVVSSGHFGASPDVLLGSLDEAQEVGCDTVILAYLPPENFVSLQAIDASAELINTAHAQASARGMTFGYHNHWWEFETILESRTAWSHLWDRLHPGVIAELDMYWATVGGADPKRIIAELGDRLQLLHVKDGPADDPKSAMVSVGSGTLDIAAILGAAPTAKWHVVELDRCDTDMFTAIEDSYRFLTSAGLSRGRK
jgi:sugar phosphate isomerase/epimerase